MKNWTRISLFSAFASSCLHFYLLSHFYPLRFGFAAEGSACDINQTFNCDSVATSQFADIFGIPLAGFGFVYSAVLFVVIMLGWLNWSTDAKKYRVLASQLSLVSAFVSIALIVVSFTAMKQYCLICFTLHALTFLTLWANLKVEKITWQDWLPLENPGLKAGAILGIPLMAFLVHKSYLQSYGAGEIQRTIQNAVLDWQTDKPKTFTAKALLSKGAPAESAKMVIREFADLLCHHCKTAAPSLSAFVEANRDDVRLEFYLFPLDANCNPEMTHSSGLSCTLSRILVCAEKQNFGWQVQEKLFENQEQFFKYTQPDDLANQALALFKDTALDPQKIKECMIAPETNATLVEQSRQGKAVQVEGTPTIYVSDKKLSRGQMIPVLQAVHKIIRSQ